jgi:hypothetical protein
MKISSNFIIIGWIYYYDTSNPESELDDTLVCKLSRLGIFLYSLNK